jgi:hypothetical protein
MMYGLSICSDSSIELFDITDTMVEGIVEDVNLENSDMTVNYYDDAIGIRNKNLITTYFYNKEDRKEMVLGLL